VPYEDRGQAIERVKDERRTYLAGRATGLRNSGADVDLEVAFGDPAEEILRIAASRDVDLIVMATHGRTGLAQTVFGSVAARVVGSGIRPVLLVRPDRLK
jgi:nucleotide-binding universal stress UspA family protein